MASGLSSSGSDLFPPALHVLAVDDDLGSLIALEKMLLQCSYQVTKCQRAEDALSLLRENNRLFDILLTEIQMPEMNGFQLLAETLKLPINLPVIFFSADLDQDMAKDGLCAGASYVLSKPISMDILKVIWQLAYCFAKRFDLGRGGSVALVVPNKGLEDERDNNLSCGGQEESYQNNSNITEKPRFSWTEERHNLFVEAVQFFGVDSKGIPKKILKYMQRQRKDSYLTRLVISSHLQKYRWEIAAKQGASYDKDNSSEAPYSRYAIQHTSSEIPPMRYTGTSSPCSIQMPTISNITPAVSSSQSSYLDQGTKYRECSQNNENEPNHNRNLNVPLPSFSWTKERHNLFVEAVQFLGVDSKGVPTKILEYMQRRRKDSYLTRQVISSHLQKYRGKIAAKQGASHDKDNSSEAPYSRDAIQHTSSEIPPMRYTETPSPCSIQMPTTSNITPAVSSSQSSYLDQGIKCSQKNENEPKHNWNLNVPLPSESDALQQNAVGSSYYTRAVPQPNQHLSFQDLVNEDL